MRKILWYNSLFANKNGKLKPSNCNMQKKKKKKKKKLTYSKIIDIDESFYSK